MISQAVAIVALTAPIINTIIVVVVVVVIVIVIVIFIFIIIISISISIRLHVTTYLAQSFRLRPEEG